MAHIVNKRHTQNGRRYDVKWRVQGKPRERTFRRRIDAEAWKRKIEGDEMGGVALDPRSGDVTLDTYARRWIDNRIVKGRPLTPATRQGYRSLLRRNVALHLGHWPLRKIGPEQVRDWYAEATRSASADQAAKSYRLLRAIFNTAVDDERIGRNPCRLKGAGAESAAERPMVDAGTVLDLAEAVTPRLRALVLLAGFAGLRSGEMLALTRADVDLVHRVVKVRAGAQEIVGMGRVVGDPKSAAGRRTVALPTVVVDALDDHLSTWVADEPDGLLFVAARGGPLRRAELSDRWRSAVATVDAPAGLHVHDLRHHAATVMARMPGVTTKELMARIGHASPRAALIYQHATDERDRALADHMDNEIAGARRRPTAAVTTLRRSQSS